MIKYLPNEFSRFGELNSSHPQHMGGEELTTAEGDGFTTH